MIKYTSSKSETIVRELEVQYESLLPITILKTDDDYDYAVLTKNTERKAK